MDTVAVIIPVYKEMISHSDEISLKQGFSVLRSHPFVLVCPSNLNATAYYRIAEKYGASISIERFSPEYFTGLTSYNGLLMSIDFYSRFFNYRYILIYQTDAFVFRDELEYWCNLDYDYIGAPIFDGWYNAKPDAKFLGIGNGGFSLRKVKGHIRALQTFAYIYSQLLSFKQFLRSPSVNSFKAFALNFVGKNDSFHRFNGYPINEDGFWGYKVAKYCRWFKVPDMETALKFSVETLPERFISSEKDLPFGCHAWPNYRKDFWLKYIQ